MILTTTSSIEGKSIIQYYGLVTGEAILGANIFKDFMAGIRDVVGGRSSAYEKSLRQAKDTAIEEMVEAGQKLGANAIIGIDIDYETISLSGGGGMVSVQGGSFKMHYIKTKKISTKTRLKLIFCQLFLLLDSPIALFKLSFSHFRDTLPTTRIC